MGSGKRQSMWLGVCAALLLATMLPGFGAAALYQAQGRTASSDYSGLGTPFDTQELESLLAPIALYPDPLLAQMMIAATYPDQVVAANDWLRQNSNVTGNALIQAVNSRGWDPSVKALTQFPAVVNNMVRNLAWTSQLGEAYHNQQSDVMAALQAMRAKAQAAGNLKSGQQMIVSQPTPDIIVIQPQTPQIVYVPQYNTAAAYGSAVQTPGYSSPEPAGGAVSFAAETSVAGSAGGGDWGWGWSSWNCNWYHGVATFHDYPYYGNNAWHGGYYGGYNYYGNHTYHTIYDFAHPYADAHSVSLHDLGKYGSSETSGSSQIATASGKATIGVRAVDSSSAWDRSGAGWRSPEELRGWGPADSGVEPTAFSNWNDPASRTGFGSEGWDVRTASFHGWREHPAGGGGGWGTGGRVAGAR